MKWIFVCLFLMSNSYASSLGIDQYLSHGLGNSFELTKNGLRAPNDFNLSSSSDEKISIYSKTIPFEYEGVGAGQKRTVVSFVKTNSSETRVTILKDESYADDKGYYEQEISTYANNTEAGDSLTECSIFSQSVGLTNKDYREGKFSSLLHSLVWGKKRQSIEGLCFTVTSHLCENLKKDFQDPDYSKISRDLKYCESFSKKLTDSTMSENGAETIAQKNIEAISDLFERISINPKAKDKVKVDWYQFYTNLGRGERSGAYHAIQKVGKMLTLCQKIDLRSSSMTREKIKNNTTKATRR